MQIVLREDVRRQIKGSGRSLHSSDFYFYIESIPLSSLSNKTCSTHEDESRLEVYPIDRLGQLKRSKLVLPNLFRPSFDS